MDIKRRDFLRLIAGAAAAGGVAGVVKTLTAEEKKAVYATSKQRWVFLVDTNKCVGCGMCVRGCKLENEIPYEAPITRTWVERYVVLKDGRVLADNPMGARDGYTANDPQGKAVKPEDIKKAFFVPKLCNQCDKPPCVQVCPVGATYRTADGVVLVDRKWCIGCGYCIMGCPYGVRFFNPVHKVAEKCNWCYHRIHKGLEPACVFACPFGARKIGDFKNPDDPVTKTIMTERVSILKDEYGTKPMVYYLGLDENVR
jgi:Fe-S-cluster-containing dehydrogenase component